MQQLLLLMTNFHRCTCLLRPGEHAELQRQESADGHSFQQGDKVKCLLEVDILRQMQEGHGGWNPKMAEVEARNSPWFSFEGGPSFTSFDCTTF